VSIRPTPRATTAPLVGAAARDRLVAELRRLEPELRRRGVRRLRLFGSVARGEADADSDVDLLAEIDRGAVASGPSLTDGTLPRPVGCRHSGQAGPWRRESSVRPYPLVGNSLVYGGDFRRLAWLCASFLGAVLVSAALKFVLGLCSSAAGWCSRAAATSARSWRA
jgi:Nucleotidyltransferase domain